MTREEAIEFIAQSVKSDVDMALVADAIKALDQEPFKPMVEIDLYSVIKWKYIKREVLDKIRAEIEDLYSYVEFDEDIKTSFNMIRLEEVERVIDKYMAESEEK